MAALAFSEDPADIVTFRKAIFRMILSRAKARLTDPADIEELELSEAMEGISFPLLDEGQRARLTEAVFEGTKSLKEEVDAGTPVEEQVREGADEKLDEVLALLARFRP
ncbi:MAG: hypothetical protein ACXVBY_21570 [Isosphaeraceae bacterium]